MNKLFLLIAFFIICTLQIFPCTITAVGNKATSDGSVIVSHTDDGLNDARLIYVPAMNHKKGENRSVYYSQYSLDYKPQYGASQSCRLVTKERGPGYDTKNVPPGVPLGFIPQVPHTYAYFDANYGVMNEFQLSIAECTDKAKVHPEPEPGKRIFYSAELSRVALERCKTAKEAVILMGNLIEQYGYYGTGETLAVADKDEIWIMEMCGYDMNGTDGVWVAQRVPDVGFFVAANQFRIREIHKDANDMIYSKNIFDAAKSKLWWNPDDGELDWTRVYGDGEFHHPYYSLRRVWRAMSLIAPSLHLPTKVEDAFTKIYPFSIPPDKKLSVSDIFSIHRDNYEGTEFDLSIGMAAGPFGDPNRFEGQAEGMADKEGKMTSLIGEFERPLNIYRCVYSFVNQSRKNFPDPIGGISWFGEDRAATTVFIPFYAGVKNLPSYLQKADILKMDKDSMWTAFNYVANYAMLKYSYMIKDIIEERTRFENSFMEKQTEIEKQALNLWEKGNKTGSVKLLTDYCNKISSSVIGDWWKLSENLYIKYNDGYINTKDNIGTQVFYPSWWLKDIGYEKGPVKY